MEVLQSVIKVKKVPFDEYCPDCIRKEDCTLYKRFQKMDWTKWEIDEKK